MQILDKIAAKITFGCRCNRPKVCDDSGLKLLREMTKQLEKHEIEICNLENTYRQHVIRKNEMVMLARPDGKIAYLSDNCIDILGYDPKELVGTTSIYKVVHPDDLAEIRKVFHNALSGRSGINLRYKIITKQGETKEIIHSWTPVYVNKRLHLIASIVYEARYIVSNN